jgi:ubiquinone/menaquinone biosynthesis C-methylase UbiE
VQEVRVNALIEAAAPGRLSVLEVGGGHAQLTGPLLAAGHRVVVQGSRVVCHRRLDRHAGRIGRVASDLWRLPFDDRCFDLVLGIRLLAHVEAWRELLAEMARVSRRLVMVDFPVQGALHRLAPALFGAKRHLEGNTRPYFDYSLREIEDAFCSLGLRRAGMARQYALPMALHRFARSPALSRSLEACAAVVGFTERVGSPILLLAERNRAEEGRRNDSRRKGK